MTNFLKPLLGLAGAVALLAGPDQAFAESARPVVAAPAGTVEGVIGRASCRERV